MTFPMIRRFEMRVDDEKRARLVKDGEGGKAGDLGGSRTDEQQVSGTRDVRRAPEAAAEKPAKQPARYDPDCTFCRIVARIEPAHIVYEDDFAIAFLDLLPLTRGHALCIPKDHYAILPDLPVSLGQHLGGILPKLAKAVTEAMGCPGVCNMVQNNGSEAGQVVHHIHWHCVPRSTPFASAKTGWRDILDDDEAVVTAEKIKQVLAKL